MSKQTFPEVLVNDIADGAQILNTTVETVIYADYQFSANDSRIYPGAELSVECYFDCSFVVTTPGTITLRLRWGGVSGSILAASGAFAPDPTSALANRSGYVKFDATWRSTGAAGSAWTMGFMHINDFDDASATTLQGNENMGVIPPNTPALVSSLDTTAAKALSLTAQFSVSTATTQLTGHKRKIVLWN